MRYCLNFGFTENDRNQTRKQHTSLFLLLLLALSLALLSLPLCLVIFISMRSFFLRALSLSHLLACSFVEFLLSSPSMSSNLRMLRPYSVLNPPVISHPSVHLTTTALLPCVSIWQTICVHLESALYILTKLVSIKCLCSYTIRCSNDSLFQLSGALAISFQSRIVSRKISRAIDINSAWRRKGGGLETSIDIRAL